MVQNATDLSIFNDSNGRQLQRELSSLKSWSSDHLLSFKRLISSSASYVITKKKKALQTLYIVNGSQIKDVTCKKDLGVLISSNLSWDDHFELLESTVSKVS